MMKKPVILLLLVLILLMSFGCSGPVHTNPQETINTRVGKGFTIGLHVVKRLGASWRVSYDEEMLTLVLKMRSILMTIQRVLALVEHNISRSRRQGQAKHR